MAARLPNDVSFVVSDAIIGLMCIAATPNSSSGYWFEVDNGEPDSNWIEVKVSPSFTVYKGDSNAS
jgi:hypothetical protein